MKRRLSSDIQNDKNSRKAGFVEETDIPEDNKKKRRLEVTEIPATQQLSGNLKTSAAQYGKQHFPHFAKPVELGRFSLDEKRRFRHDSSQLRRFSPPGDWENCSFDLRDGYHEMICRDESKKEYLDDLLRWIQHNKQAFISARRNSTAEDAGVFNSLKTDFVCWRGLLTRLLCIPYEKQEDLLVAVVRWRSTFFMCEFDTESKKLRTQQESPRQKEMCAWGFKFEQYVTADTSSSRPGAKPAVNTNMAFCSVARSRLESHSFVFGAEVDCEATKNQTEKFYVELKTSRLIESQRQQENFCRFKLIKWWAQSFLIGIPQVVCGFRDDEGMVRKLRSYQVLDIPSFVRSSVKYPWNPNVCFSFLEAFLQFVKSKITADNERCVYLFKWQPGSDVTCENRGDDPQFNFLPDWFLKWEAWDTPCSEAVVSQT